MFRNKRILAIIPARGGSKGVPDKNIKHLLGKPLIGYTIEAAKKSKYIDDIIVSTDSEAIKNIAIVFGAHVPFLRPESLSGDSVKSIDVVLHCIDYIEKEGKEYDYFILLQPTSPLRSEAHIDEAIEMITNLRAESLVSVCEVEQNPVIMRIIEDNRMKEIIKFDGDNLRRQDLPKFYIFNGAVYINSKQMLINSKSFVNEDSIPYIMDSESSIDIDTITDFKLAEILIKEKKYV